MKLYYAPTSPYVRKVMVMLHLGGLVDQVEKVAGGGTPVAPNQATVGVNPLGKIPCLITDDGQTLYDSRVICRYLDKQAGLGLYPTGADEFRVQTVEATADGICDAAILGVYEKRIRPEEIRFQDWIDAQMGKVNRAITALEAEAGLLNGPVTAGHIAAGCALGYLDFRMPDLGWRDGAPQLAAWYAGFAERPEMVATVPVE